MPGYEPFLLCDFHTHTTWSDGGLTIRELIDLKDWPSLKTALCDNMNVAITLYRGESWTDARARAQGTGR